MHKYSRAERGGEENELKENYSTGNLQQLWQFLWRTDFAADEVETVTDGKLTG